MGAPIRRAILQSGSLHLSPPQPESSAKVMIGRVEDALSKNGHWTLSNAPVEELLKAQAELGIVSLFLQMESALKDWQDKLGNAERLLVGDCEYEVNQDSFKSVKCVADDPTLVSDIAERY